MGHTETVFALAFWPDSKTIASGAFDKTIRLWDAETGEMRLCDRSSEVCTTQLRWVRFTPDGRTVLAAQYYEGTILLWDAETGAPKESATDAYEFGVEPVTRNGVRLTSRVDNTVSIPFTLDQQRDREWSWCLSSGKVLACHTVGPRLALMELVQ
jgi:WD40 repeat protein